MRSGRVDVAFRASALGDLVLCSSFVSTHATAVDCPLYFFTDPSLQDFVTQCFPKHPSFKVFGETFKGAKGLWRACAAGYRCAKQICLNHSPSEINFYDLHDVVKSHAFGLGMWWALKSSPLKYSVMRSRKHSFLRQLSILLGRDLLPKRWVYVEHQELLGARQIQTPSLRTKSESSEKLILLAPAASKWKKEWPLDQWVALIPQLEKALPDYRLQVVAPAGHKLTEALRSAVNSSRLEWKTDLSLTELPSFASKSSLVLCGNSAWLHLAEACGTPVVALEGPIPAGFGFSPWRSKSASLEIADLKCRPCSKHGGGICRLRGPDHHACMTRLTPQKVLFAIMATLGSAGETP